MLNGRCVPVSDHCADHDQDGDCTKCFDGYALRGDVCEAFNPLCKSVHSNGTCASCYTGYALYKSSCTPLKNLADIYLYYA